MGIALLKIWGALMIIIFTSFIIGERRRNSIGNQPIDVIITIIAAVIAASMFSLYYICVSYLLLSGIKLFI